MDVYDDLMKEIVSKHKAIKSIEPLKDDNHLSKDLKLRANFYQIEYDVGFEKPLILTLLIADYKPDKIGNTPVTEPVYQATCYVALGAVDGGKVSHDQRLAVPGPTLEKLFRIEHELPLDNRLIVDGDHVFICGSTICVGDNGLATSLMLCIDHVAHNTARALIGIVKHHVEMVVTAGIRDVLTSMGS